MGFTTDSSEEEVEVSFSLGSGLRKSLGWSCSSVESMRVEGKERQMLDSEKTIFMPILCIKSHPSKFNGLFGITVKRCVGHKSGFHMDLTFKGCFIVQEIGTLSIVPLVLRVYVVVGWIDDFLLVLCPAYVCGILKPNDLVFCSIYNVQTYFYPAHFDFALEFHLNTYS